MLIQSQVVAAFSGSAGGLTASRNRYGQYFRARVNPVNPQSVNQSAVRGVMQVLVNRWIEVLDDDQRAGWEAYAANVPLTGSLGAAINVTGQSMFIRSNLQRVRAVTGAGVNDAPTVFDLGSFTPGACTFDVATNVVAFTFTNTDAWANEAGGSMYLFIGRMMGDGRTFYGGPWRYVGRVAGAAMPPTSPSADFAYPFGTLATGARLKYRLTAARADGRYSQDFRGFAVPV